jgi:hypothetical protein|tara:strand:+ start:5691 stop:5855 length:165 start_codon:yes stop_codon:yes gene_type:complete
MSRTIEELVEYLVEFYDPDLVVEILEITTEELCDRFDDKLEVAMDKGSFDEELR